MLEVMNKVMIGAFALLSVLACGGGGSVAGPVDLAPFQGQDGLFVIRSMK